MPQACCSPLRTSGGLHSLLSAVFFPKGFFPLILFVLASAFLGLGPSAIAQQTNPVDRKVINPMTDTPNVNPLTQDQPIRPRLPAKQGQQGGATEDLKIDAGTQIVSGPKDARIFVYEGNVDARIGTYRLHSSLFPLRAAMKTSRTSCALSSAIHLRA